jgi:hypothetical protein
MASRVISIKFLPVIIITTMLDVLLLMGAVMRFNRSSRRYIQGSLKASEPVILLSNIFFGLRYHYLSASPSNKPQAPRHLI